MSRKKIWQPLDEGHPALKHHGADAGYVRVFLKQEDAWWLLRFSEPDLYPTSGEWQLIKDERTIDRYGYYGRVKVKPPTTWANKIIEDYYRARA